MDLDLVVDTIHTLYSPNSVFLYGISWGGTLAVAYLTDPARQAKVKGLIEECGTTNMILTLETSSLILSDYAKSQVEQGIKADFWQEAVDFFSASADVAMWGLEEYRTYGKYLSSAKPYNYTTNRYPGEITGPDAEMVFLSSLSLAMFFNKGALIPRFNILSLNLNPEMAAITLPVFIAWGQYDLNGGTTALAENLRDSLGTASGDIDYHVFPNAGHNPCIDQPALYLPLVAEFIEAYR
jgi:pimeloyl-ACP methyl ester carboxylesterase